MTLPRTQSAGNATKAANNAAAATGETLEVSKTDKVSGANSSSSVYDNVNAAATAAKRNVETYATLRQARAAAAAAASAANNSTESAKDDGQRGASAPQTASAASKIEGQSGPQSNAAANPQTPHPPEVQQPAQAATEAPPTHTQSVTTQTQTPASNGGLQQETSNAAAAAANLMAHQSINHRTQQQQQPAMYQYPSAFQQPPHYGTLSQGYYNEMQGAIPRTYSQQQQQQQYHGLQHPSMNPHANYYSPHVNYSHFGTLQPAMYRQDQPYHHPQHPQHPYYQRAYSVQGYSSNDMPADHQHMRHTLKHPIGQRREMLSSKSVDYSDLDATNVNGAKLMDGGGRGGRRSRSRSIEDMHGVVGAGSKSDVSNALSLDSNALKRMLQPVQSVDDDPMASPLTSPETGRRAMSGRGSVADNRSLINDGFQSEPEVSR